MASSYLYTIGASFRLNVNNMPFVPAFIEDIIILDVRDIKMRLISDSVWFHILTLCCE